MKQNINFKEALNLLIKGEVLALPTETVYGLAGRIDKEKTLEKIFYIKKRPACDPLIVHCYDKKQALEYISGESDLIEKLFAFFSPGPLTIITKKNKKISSLITAGQQTVALRIPSHPLIRKILKHLTIPLAIPSANLYGTVSPVSAQHVISSFSGTIPVLDGGICEKGLESTIILPDLQKNKIFIVRSGMITKEHLISFLKRKNLEFNVEYKIDKLQPGGQVSHYKPTVPLCILETKKNQKEQEYFLQKKFPEKNLKKINLNFSPEKIAHSLYADLRKLSTNKDNLIYVQKLEKQKGNLWEAVWDRLIKASSNFYKF